MKNQIKDIASNIAAVSVFLGVVGFYLTAIFLSFATPILAVIGGLWCLGWI